MRKILHSIDLTEEEARLRSRIKFTSTRHEDLRQACEAAAPLAKSLLRRNAVPESRLRYLTVAALHPRRRKSREDIFVEKGTRGEAILSHPHFLKYLRYFIDGSDLPDEVIDQFSHHVQSTEWTLRGDIRDLKTIARNATRQYGLEPGKAAEEFLKLGVECGLEDSEAWAIRNAIKQIR